MSGIRGKLGEALASIIAEYRDGRTKACAQALVNVVEIVDQLEAERDAAFTPSQSAEPECAGPFVDAWDCPVHRPNAESQRVKAVQEAIKLAPSSTREPDAQWCVDAFWRVNPGGNATVPSLYLLDFAREVLRVHGTRSARGANFAHIENIRMAWAEVCDGLDVHPGSTFEAEIRAVDQALEAAFRATDRTI